MTLMVSCTSKSFPVTEKGTNITDKITQGKIIFENSCGKCHDLPDPQRYSSEKWVEIINWMAPKAKITQEQQQLVYQYVMSVK